MGQGKDQESDRSASVAPLDAERARLVGSIYEVLLRPEHFPAFMEDWSAYIDQAARRLGDLTVGEGAARRTLDDPVIAAHFLRATALFERMGRGDLAEPLTDAGPPIVARLFHGEVVAADPAVLPGNGDARPGLDALCDRLTPDSATRLRGFLRGFEQAPASGRFVILSRADSAEGDGGLWSAVSVHDRALDGFAIEIRALDIGWTPQLASVMADSFGLTPREIGLVGELVGGGDLQAVSVRLGRSMNTLRAQLRSVFAKTRTHSQPELMRLVAVLMLHGVAGPEPVPPAIDRVTKVTLPGGRHLSVRHAGPQDGTPVIFVHGMLEGLGSFRCMTPHLAGAGLHLLAPNRPNFGQADADPRLREAPQVFARDLAAGLDALGLDRVVLCGHLAGALHAFAAAQHLGPRCAGLVNVSGNVPIRSIEQFASMSPRQRAVAYTARYAPALLPAVLHAAIAQIDSRNAEDFARSLYPPNCPDRALLDDPTILSALIEGYRYTVAQGIRGFQSDAWHVTRDWTRLTEGLRCPVLLIHGSEDRVSTLKSIQAFADTRPEVTLEVVKGAGQLLLYGRSMSMVDRIARFAREALGAASHAETPHASAPVGITPAEHSA